MSISVIVPAYNAETTIEACLKSIRNALPNDGEIIVVDDVSTDRTAEIAKKFASKFLSTDVNSGQAVARRMAAFQAAGDILAFVDSDVVVATDAFSTLDKYFRENPSVEAITGLLSTKHPNPNFWSQYKNLYMNFTFRHTSEDAAFLYGSFFSIRSSVRDLMPEKGRFAEDTAFGQTLVRAGKSVRLLKSLEVEHLKRYTFTSFVRNDFRIPFNWGCLMTGSGGWRHVGRRGMAFAHASWIQIASLMLAVLSVLTIVRPPIALATASIWFLINLPYHNFLAKNRGILFGVLSVPATFFDHLIMTAGAGAGIVTGFLRTA